MKFLTRLLSRNWTLKLAAIALAILLWTALRIESPSRQVIPNVPVRVELTDPSWSTVAQPLPATIEVRLSGPTRELLRLAVGQPTLVIPIDEVYGRDTTLVLSRDWVRLPGSPAVVVDDVQPSTVRLQFEPVVSAVLPFEVRTRGQLPEGLALVTAIRALPERARVSGPARLLAEHSAIPIQPISLDEIEESGTLTVLVDTAGFAGVDVLPLEVEVAITIEAGVERVFDSVSVVVAGGVGSSDPTTVRVTAWGAASVLEGFDAGALRAVPLLPDRAGSAALNVEGLPSVLSWTVEPDSVRLLQPARPPS